MLLLVGRILANPVRVKNPESLESTSNLEEIVVGTFKMQEKQQKYNIRKIQETHPLLSNRLEVPLRLLLVDGTGGLGLTWGSIVHLGLLRMFTIRE